MILCARFITVVITPFVCHYSWQMSTWKEGGWLLTCRRLKWKPYWIMNCPPINWNIIRFTPFAHKKSDRIKSKRMSHLTGPIYLLWERTVMSFHFSNPSQHYYTNE